MSEVFVIAVRPESNKIRCGRLYFDEGHALRVCEEVNEHGETPGYWKVYRAVININKEALTYAGRKKNWRLS